MLTIAVGAFPVLPSFPPMHRREADEEGACGQPGGEGFPCRFAKGTTLFERVLARRVMIHPSPIRQAGKRWQHHIALGGMQVAARRVAAQRPARALELLPGSEPER